jgi:hypothetical protein
MGFEAGGARQGPFAQERIRVVSLVAVAYAASAPTAPRPAKPRVLGPRRTADRTPTFRFVSSERGLPSRRLAVPLCARRGTVSFVPGPLYADSSCRAASPARARSRPTRADEPDDDDRRPNRQTARRPGALRSNLSRRQRPLQRRLRFRLALGQRRGRPRAPRPGHWRGPGAGGGRGRPWGIAIAKSVVWVGNQFNETIAAVDPHTNAVARQIVLDGAAPVAVAVGGGASGPRATSTTASGALIPRRARFSALRASATVTSSSAIAKAASGSRVRTARPRNSMRRREP